MADLAALQAQRAQIVKEIQRRGGAAKAPGFAKQLQALDAQIRTARGGTGGPTDAITPGTNDYPKNLSPGQADIVGSGEALTNKGLDLAMSNLGNTNLGGAFNPTLPARTSGTDLQADRSRIEDYLYKKMTRNLDKQQGLDTESAKQSLVNRGIPYSADPNSRYQQELGDIQNNYNTQRENAMQSAVSQGGQEYVNDANVNNQAINSEFNIQSGTRNQQLSEVGGLQQLGSGLDPMKFFESLSQADKDRIAQQAMAQLQSKTAVQVAGINNRGRGSSSGSADDGAFSSQQI